MVPSIRHSKVIVNLEYGSAGVFNILGFLVLYREGVVDYFHIKFDGSVTRKFYETLELLAHRILYRNPGLTKILEFVPEETILVKHLSFVDFQLVFNE